MNNSSNTREHSGSEAGNHLPAGRQAHPGVKEGVRPAWFTDAKWIVGILAFFVVAATAVVFSLTRLTERETAVALITTVTATMFSPSGLDDPGDIEKLRAQLEATGEPIEPLPGVLVTAADVGDKSPRELRLFLFRQLAEPIYDQGMFAKTGGNTPGVNSTPPTGGHTPGVKEPAEQSTALTPTADTIGFLALLSNESHQKLLGIQRILISISAVLLVLTILFSTGFGRLASPGWVLLLVSGLPLLLIFLIDMSLKTHPPAAPTGEPNIAGVAVSAGAAVAPIVLNAFKSVYQPFALTGAGLIVVATLGGMIWQFTHKQEGGA